MTTSSSKPYSVSFAPPGARAPSLEHGAFTEGERRQARRLLSVIFLIAAFCAAQFVGAAWAGSDVLRAEAIHYLADVGVLGLAWIGMRLAVRRPTARFTFGLRRAEPVLALFNALLVLGATFAVLRGAVVDWSNAVGPVADRMLVVAAAGVAVNGIAAWLIHGAVGAGSHAGHPPHPPPPDAECGDHSHLHLAHAAHHHAKGHSLNLRGAWLHLLGDALGSLSALIAALAIRLGAPARVDSAATFVVAAILISSAARLLRDALLVLLEASPIHLTVATVRDAIAQVSGVAEIHDLHVWTLGGGHEAITAHVSSGATADPALATRIEQQLRRRFPIEYVTIQVHARQPQETEG
jgi:cobalt-zinc-cadmium efflux system protein